jgi:hypothetical protein
MHAGTVQFVQKLLGRMTTRYEFKLIRSKIFLPYNIQICSGAYPASYPLEGLFPGW